MTLRMTLLLVALVVLPVAVLALVGLRAAGDEERVVRGRFDEVLAARLRDTDAAVVRWRRDREGELARLLDLVEEEKASPDELRSLERRSPLVRRFVAVGPDGRLAYPPRGGAETADGRFHERTRSLWESGGLATENPEEERNVQRSGALRFRSWFHGDGLQLLAFRSCADGGLVGAELSRARLIADLTVVLSNADGGSDGATVLRDENGGVLHQWGRIPAQPLPPRARLPLSPPFGAWTLEASGAFDDLERDLASSRRRVFGLGLLALALALGALALTAGREYGREVREALTRVSFVNRVSHELKTPLTNIRLYAEMLDEELDEDEGAPGPARRHLAVIVEESRRLSRLIANVLSFSRKERRVLTLRPSPGRVDDRVRAAVAAFEPALRARGVEVRVIAAAPAVVRFDGDAVEQIVANLVGNVEKYAASGGFLEVRSGQDGDTTTVIVTDHGPGVPAPWRERIFEPFVRVEDGVTEGASGTGIGLAIARDLARLHGGDLTFLPGEDGEGGARFTLTIRAPGVEEPESLTGGAS